jgi:nicotinamide-nucleotide amidase
MPSAELITIGTEILLGEITDTNAPYLARCLRDAGIDLYRKTTVGDNAQRIAEVVRQGLERAEIILTTGGLGPTVDDPTREAIALALGVETEFRPELWDQIQERFRRFGRKPTENNRRQAYIPRGAVAVENPVGTAPAFIAEPAGRAVIALPGVPHEMEYLMQHAVLPYLRKRFNLQGIIKARLLHTAGVGESQIDDRIADLEGSGNPTVGLAAHSGQVDVRITAKAASAAEADGLISEMERIVRERLGDWIYGADQETLEQIALDVLDRRGWSLAVVEAGLGGELIRRLSSGAGPFRGGEALPGPLNGVEMRAATEAILRSRNAQVGLGVTVLPAGERQEASILLITPEGDQDFTRPFGGPASYVKRWTVNYSLDLLRRL